MLKTRLLLLLKQKLQDKQGSKLNKLLKNPINQMLFSKHKNLKKKWFGFLLLVANTTVEQIVVKWIRVHPGNFLFLKLRHKVTSLVKSVISY